MSGLDGRADKVLALSIASAFEVRRYAETIVLNHDLWGSSFYYA
jgi:hypothetical protein